MRVSHGLRARFDEANLVSAAGLAPVLALAQRAGLHRLAGAHLTVPGPAGANAAEKVSSLVGGMAAGADSIDDMALLRHGAMGRLFGGVRAPSTLGTFLRAFTFGHVRQLDAVASRFLVNLAAFTPLLAGAEAVAYVDVDDTVHPTYGYAKAGAGYGYSGVKGLNLLLATVSSPLAAPVIVATRLRKGACASGRGAVRLVTDALSTARRAGATGLLMLRADSAYYSAGVVAAARRAGARFSLTARMDPAVTMAIASIPEDAWTSIRYKDAVWDEVEGRWVSEAQVAEVPFTAFTSRRKREHVTARLIVRRVKRLNAAGVPKGQQELFTTWRHHALFTDSPLGTFEAEAAHRDHALVEQVIADLKNGPLAHLPSGSFAANGAWAVLAAVAFNLTRAAGTLASRHHARARTATIRAQLITVPARIATTARRLHLHLPRRWPWQAAYETLFERTCGPPPAATT